MRGRGRERGGWGGGRGTEERGREWERGWIGGEMRGDMGDVGNVGRREGGRECVCGGWDVEEGERQGEGRKIWRWE